MSIMGSLFGSGDSQEEQQRKMVKDFIFQKIQAKIQENQNAKPLNIDRIIGIPGQDELNQKKDQAVKALFNQPSIGPLPEAQSSVLSQAQSQTPGQISDLRTQFDVPEGVGKLNIDQYKDFTTSRKTSSDMNKNPLDELLTPAEAEKLGVPFGTTKRQAQGKSAIRTKSPETVKFANDLRTEFINRPEVKDFIIVDTQVKSMDSLVKSALNGDIKNQLALDQGLITMFNKLTDPLSVVRESEYARTPENIPTINRISGAIQKLQAGGAGLTNEDRQALVLGAKIIANERGKQYQSTRTGYEKIAGQLGADSSLVTGTLSQFIPYAYEGSAKSFKSPLEVKQAVARGEITVQQGKDIVRNQFGFQK